MCKSSLPGIRRSDFGSRWRLAFLLAFFLFSAYSLSVQSQSSQPEPLTPYSKMTRDELLQVISDKDSLLLEWLTWSEREKALRKEQDEASAKQLQSRDKLIRDQSLVIDGYKSQEAMTWLERTLWALGGAAMVLGVNALTPKR